MTGETLRLIVFLFIFFLLAWSVESSANNDCPLYLPPANDPSPALVSDWRSVADRHGVSSTSAPEFQADEGQPDDSVKIYCAEFSGNTSNTRDNFFWTGQVCTYRRGDDGNTTIGVMGDVLPDSCSDIMIPPVYNNDFLLGLPRRYCRPLNDVVQVVFAKTETFQCDTGYELISGECVLIDQCPVTICDDGFPEDAAVDLGYTTCDRPPLQECNGIFLLDTDICIDATNPVLDSGTDSTTDPTPDPVFDSGTGPTNTDPTSDPVVDSGIGSTNTDPTSDPVVDSGIGSTNTDPTPDPAIDSGTGTGTAPSSNNTGGGTYTGASGTIGTSGTGGSGPCDPTQPNYYQCLNTPLNNLPVHSQPVASSFDQVNQNFKNRLDNSPIVQSFSGVATMLSLSDPQCPRFEIEFPAPISKNISTDIHCGLMDTIASLISIVMIVIYTFTGFRIFASA